MLKSQFNEHTACWKTLIGGHNLIIVMVYLKYILCLGCRPNNFQSHTWYQPRRWKITSHSHNQIITYCLTITTRYAVLITSSHCCAEVCPCNSLRPSNAYIRRSIMPPFVQIIVCHLFGPKSLTITWINVGSLSIGPLGTNFSEISINIRRFPLMKLI